MGKRVFGVAVLLALVLLSMPAACAATVIGSENDDEARRIAAARAAMAAQTLGHYGMTPVYARDIADGQYPVSVESDSPYFKIVRALLTVEGDVAPGSAIS